MTRGPHIKKERIDMNEGFDPKASGAVKVEVG